MVDTGDSRKLCTKVKRSFKWRSRNWWGSWTFTSCTSNYWRRCFIGSRCIVVEGVHVGKEAVLGANVCLTASTKIIDVTGDTCWNERICSCPFSSDSR
jgi:hypothetical protein